MESTKGKDVISEGNFPKLLFFGNILISIISVVFAVLMIENGSLFYKSLGIMAFGLSANMIYSSFKRLVSKKQ